MIARQLAARGLSSVPPGRQRAGDLPKGRRGGPTDQKGWNLRTTRGRHERLPARSGLARRLRQYDIRPVVDNQRYDAPAVAYIKFPGHEQPGACNGHAAPCAAADDRRAAARGRASTGRAPAGVQRRCAGCLSSPQQLRPLL